MLKLGSGFGIALATPLLVAACEHDMTPAQTDAPDSGAASGSGAVSDLAALADAGKNFVVRWVGAVEGTDARVAVILGVRKARLFFCGGADSYASATRWFDIEPEGEHLEFEDDTWHFHAHVLLGVSGEVERPGDSERPFYATVIPTGTIAGLYEGKAGCGRIGLIVTQASKDAAPIAQGACTGENAESVQRVNPVEPIRVDQGKIRVQTPGGSGETTLLQLSELDPL